MEPNPYSPQGRQNRFGQTRKANQITEKMSYEEMLELITKYQSQERQAYQNKPKGKIQGPKYEPYQNKEQPHSEKLFQSILIQQNKNSKPEQKRSSPSTKDKFNSYLDQTGTGQYQHSDSQYSYSQSAQSTDSYASPEVSTIAYTANTSNFSYKTKSDKNQLQQFSRLLQMNQSNISEIYVQPQSPINKEKIRQLDQQFDETFNLLKHQKTSNNLLRAMTSREQLRSQPDLYHQDKKTFLFKMVLPSQKGISLNKRFFDNLKKTDHFLLSQVGIGIQIQFNQLSKIFEKYYQSLRKVIISRHFDEDFEEHGFNFIKSIQNQEGLVQIEWKSNKLTETLASTFETSKLTNLIQLTIDLDQKVENEKACGDLIKSIFTNIDEINQNGFKIVLCSSVEKKQNLGKKINIYKNRIEIKPKTKNINPIQKSEKKQNPSQDKQHEPSFIKKKKQSPQSPSEVESQTQQQLNRFQQIPAQQAQQSFSRFTFTTSGGQMKNFSIGGNQYGN